MERNRTPEEYINKQTKWKEGLERLREILLSTELKEEVKWGIPVYTFESKNVVGIGAFKNYFALWFFQGALLKDPAGHLVNAQEGKTKALRQWRFLDLGEIQEKLLLEYVEEAVENQKIGKDIKPEKRTIPEELQDLLDKDTPLSKAFSSFTIGKQREFAVYITEAKRTETKSSRLKKIIHDPGRKETE